MKPSSTIYTFRTYGEFLAAYIHERKRDKSSFSYGVLSSMAGLKSSTSVAMVATGKRPPSPNVLVRINKAIGMSWQESVYAEILVAHEKVKDPVLIKEYSKLLQLMKQKKFAEPKED